MAKAKKRDSTIPPPTMSVATPEPEVATATAPQSAGDTTVAGGDRDRIAMRAYELYLARGGSQGGALDDWLTAEQEINAPGRRDRSE